MRYLLLTLILPLSLSIAAFATQKKSKYEAKPKEVTALSVKGSKLLHKFTFNDRPKNEAKVKQTLSAKKWKKGVSGHGGQSFISPNKKFKITSKELPETGGDTVPYAFYFQELPKGKVIQLTNGDTQSNVHISPNSKYFVLGHRFYDFEKWVYFDLYKNLKLNLTYPSIEVWTSDGKSFVMYDQPCPYDCPKDLNVTYHQIELK